MIDGYNEKGHINNKQKIKEEPNNLVINKIERKKSNYNGVKQASRSNKWEATISKDNKRFHLGTFETELEAARAYNIKALELYGNEYKKFNTI